MKAGKLKRILESCAEIYQVISENDTKRIKAPFDNDGMFHYIDNDGNDIGSAPLLTFNELVLVPHVFNNLDPSICIFAYSFNKQLFDHDDKQKKIILNYFIDSLELFKQTQKFNAPFVTICQSSGVGKSRFVLDCGEDIPLVYGVFRANTDKGYPPMSAWIKSFMKFVLDANNDQTGQHYTYVDAELSPVGRVLVYIDGLLEAYKELYTEIMGSNNSLTPVDVFKEINKKFRTPQGQKEFESRIKLKSKLSIDAICRHITATAEFFSSLNANLRKTPFIIVFDELFLLLEVQFQNKTNLFYTIKHALYLIPSNLSPNLLIVGIGTNGDVSLFHKELTDDSRRYLDRKYFLPPLVLGSNWDIFKPFINLDKFKLSIDNVTNAKMIKLLCSFGRALWSSLGFDQVLPIACEKLRNGSGAYYTSLAIWSIRTSLSMNSDLIASRTLLRSYMAIAYAVSYNAATMNVGYPSEPILAIAARLMIHQEKSFNFPNLLEVLLEFVQLRPVDKGEINEVIFAQIVLLAIDKSQNLVSKTVNRAISYDQSDRELKNIFESREFLLESRSPN